MQFRIGLEFAVGTTNECKKLVERVVPSRELLVQYKNGQVNFGTSDLVLRISATDPSGFRVQTRKDFIRDIIAASGGKLPDFFKGMAAASAHKVAQVPLDSDAMWLVVDGLQMPIMCVVYAVKYKIDSEGN